jgi:glutamate 5-kinase
MDLEKRPKSLPKVQALAAIGQCKLMSIWDTLFSLKRKRIGQILLTRSDIADRTQYLNAQNTFFQLLDMGAIPIVNENDTLAVSEIKFGDNDTLSAITAGMVHADYLFLMTDVDCLYDKNPRTNPDAKPIHVVSNIDELEADVSSLGSSLGTGGMSTKITAARRATSVGVTTIITRSSRPGNILGIIDALENPSADTDAANPAPLHTRFLPSETPMRDRHFWLLHLISPRGTLYIDEKAYAALVNKANLFPSGIVDVEGTFAQQEAVRLVVVKRIVVPNNNNNNNNPSSTSTPPRAAGDPPSLPPTNGGSGSGTGTGTNSPHTAQYEKLDPPPLEVGRAIVNYSWAETRWIKGLQATEIAAVLGYADTEYVAFRENIALFKSEKSRPATPVVGPVKDVVLAVV